MSFDFITYMQACATNLKDIGHSESSKKFFRISGLAQLDEVLGNLSDIAFPAILVHDNTEGSIADRSISDNYLDSPYFTFYIIDHVEYGNYQAQEEAKANCKAIGMKILAKMLRDKNRGNFGLTFLQFSNIPYQSIGPIGDNCYGVMFSFSVPDAADLIYNADDWD
jgi:hypothetical protein